MCKSMIVALLSALIIFSTFGGVVYAQGDILIGAIIDKTGKTKDVGSLMAMAVEDYFNYVNEQGGIKGRKINLLMRDNRYDVFLATQQYQELKDKGVVAIIGWGTGESMALTPQVNEDHITWLPGSMAESLVGPGKPYNFILTASYEDQFYALLSYAATHPKAQGRPARVAFVFNSTPFGKAPIKKATAIVRELNMELVKSEIVELDEPNADRQMEKLLPLKPDYIIIQETGVATVAILKSCAKFGLRTTVMGTFYSGDAIIIAKTEDALKDGVELIVASPMARWYEDVPGMAKIKEFSAIHHPEMKEWPPAYIEGWIMAMLYTEVLNKCGDIITREKFRDILESIKDFDPGKLMPSVSYGPDKHKGTTKVKIYKANARAKRFEALTDWVE